jgi:hypothetical protein
MQDPYPFTRFRSQWPSSANVPVAVADVEDAFVALQAQIGQRTLGDKLLHGV